MVELESSLIEIINLPYDNAIIIKGGRLVILNSRTLYIYSVFPNLNLESTTDINQPIKFYLAYHPDPEMIILHFYTFRGS